jgi:uncharacterized MAPEG superfamily protein
MNQPALLAYAITCVILCAQLISLWIYSGVVRGRTKTALNQEDAAHFGATLVDSDPPSVARILRVHANGQANVYPFLALGLVYVLAGGGATWAAVVFAVFVVARLLHTVMYLKERQPWRMVAFLAGMLATVALMISVILLAVR